MFIEHNGDRYWVTIEGEGIPLVLLHGFTGTVHTWETLRSQWQNKFQVITIDLPGHGQTEVHPPYSMQTTCAAIFHLLKTLEYDHVHILGYSLGGRTAISFVNMYPEMVKTLIVESGSPGLKTQEEQELRIKNDEMLATMIEEEGLQHFVEYWAHIPLFASQKRLPKAVQEKIKKERLSQKGKGLADSLRYMGTGKQPSLWDKLSYIQIPTLFITGSYDQKFVEINNDMQKLLPNAIHKVIMDAGHAVHVEQPKFFGKIVSDFILHNE
ncbi:2-succinyl-6-hydroxy-2,4-cyclohexadiene-1-carboxylate synthase [Salirhabdus euzebyi]|uniref:Putative 2-succinyl-6-hydroxy-2,4-cyclohexadiene-1-carboxylate synthase n=1 Tax=Salirhabdus euzebyi TaxID=394506 RepID=A0A841Q4X0_9BACI|nr:2-succinyl-6-hydroxy-2,4-cyclohexadiene-1-carboxylate synthase [Salirhabdus euzebyi]MBB6453403.1 2-succinyl-6-hydroxy-2,4-cyclohexadiene-1-carboxylate synthase [Salirhabdus euzebyi]